MNGYDLITAVDDKRWGTVVDEQDDFVIVEHGSFRKHRYAVPKSSVDVDQDAKQVRTTLSGELIGESPKVDDGLDRDTIARHYGLGETSEVAGGETATEERAQTREGATDDGMPDESPALLGERISDVPEDRR
jgi:hypothetical protein